MNNSNYYLHLLTPTGEKFNEKLPLSQYPRPMLKRSSYHCLNGVWEYCINTKPICDFTSDGEIIVPYPIESRLSKVQKHLLADEFLHYRRFFDKPLDFTKSKTLLHFGAVDQKCSIYLNKHLIFENEGGYWPFSVDITKYLQDHNNELVVIVTDASNIQTNLGFGKQAEKRGEIWYTPCSGIWQTVWLENVPDNYVRNLILTPLYDDNKLEVKLDCTINYNGLIQILNDDEVIYQTNFSASSFILDIPSLIPWTPENPKLYHVIIKLNDDEITSYFGMRKFSTGTSPYGPCFTLNNKPYFMNGLLDQGYYSDGIYTPASYQEMENDIILTKKAGYNTLRKHIKIEPMIWYYYCDLHGIIVWQDMINSGSYSFFNDTALPTIGFKKKRDDQLAFNPTFECEMIKTFNHLRSVPCIALWTIFNEGWGQHQTKYYYNILSNLEHHRLIDHASGWFDQNIGLIDSRHVYFKKINIKKRDLSRVLSLSEFGGYSYKVLDHSFNQKKNFGYRFFTVQELFEDCLIELYENEIIPNIKKGLASAIYTQLSDVEDETNGLITYDRKVVKCNLERLAKINRQCHF